jgi:hypothetical protein
VTVIYPPDSLVTNDLRPVIFLAGPIQGAPDWQSKVIDRIARTAGDIDLIICNPRAPDPWHGDFERQVDWELLHLERAARCGCILFWLASEEVHNCERAYAQTSRFELGEWVGRWIAAERGQGPDIVVGIQPGFTNAGYIRQRLQRIGMADPDWNLAGTADEAVRVIREKYGYPVPHAR